MQVRYAQDQFIEAKQRVRKCGSILICKPLKRERDWKSKTGTVEVFAARSTTAVKSTMRGLDREGESLSRELGYSTNEQQDVRCKYLHVQFLYRFSNDVV